MDRRSWCRRAGAMAVGGWLAGCGTLALREPVQVHVVGLEQLPGEGMELRMAVKLRVQNPNDAALDYDGIALALDVAGSTFASGVSAGRGSVPRFGETVVTVPVSVSALNVLRQVINMTRQGRPSRIDYVMRGRMSSAAFGGMRFQSKGEIDLPEGMTGPQ